VISSRKVPDLENAQAHLAFGAVLDTFAGKPGLTFWMMIVMLSLR
jgi:hypothetical protein